MNQQRVPFLRTGNWAHSQIANLPDPAAACGTEADRSEAFRQLQDGLRQRMLTYAEQMENGEMEDEFDAPREL